MDHQQNFNLDSDTNDIIKNVYYSCTEIFPGKVGHFQRTFQNILGKKGKETGLGFQSGLWGGGRVRLPEDSLNFPPEPNEMAYCEADGSKDCGTPNYQRTSKMEPDFIIHTYLTLLWFFLGGSDSKKSTCQARDAGLDPWVRKFP